MIFAAMITILITVGSAFAWRAGGPPHALLDPRTPTRVLVLGYVVLCGIGSIVLAATGEATGGPVLVAAAMVAIGTGAWFARRFLGPDVPISTDMQEGALRRQAVVTLAVLGLAAFVSLALDHGLPLLSPDAQAARAGYSGVRLDLFRWLVPPAALVALGIYLATRRRDAMAIAILATGGSIALEVLAASRALPFELGLAALLLVLWAGRQLRIRTWILIAGATIALFLGVLFARVAPEGGFSGVQDVLEFAWNRSVGRVILIQPRTIDLVVETFPEQEPYLLGSSYVRWIDGVAGREPRRSLGSWLFERLFPNEPAGGFLAPGVLAEGYANFGPVFALGLMAVLGAATTWLGRALQRAPAEVAIRVLAAVVTVALLRTYATSLNGTLVTITAAVAWWAIVDPRLLHGLRARARFARARSD